jgi:hypothetical protein
VVHGLDDDWDAPSLNPQVADILVPDWLTLPLAILLGVLLVLMPYYTRVRRHQRMSDQDFLRVGRGALFAQSLGVGLLVGIGGVALLALLSIDQGRMVNAPRVLMLVVLMVVIEFHLLARFLQSMALGSRHRRLRRGQRWQPGPMVQYILAYPAFMAPAQAMPQSSTVAHSGQRSITPGLDPPVLPAPRGQVPATFQDILDAVQRQVAEANARAEALEQELAETRRHVTRLEHDLIERRAEIVLLEAAQDRFELDLASETDRQDGKALSMQDSVVAGDAFVGSTVIDRHIVNDPEAIARAVLDAYRSGRGEA